jgi:hypothetical protein
LGEDCAWLLKRNQVVATKANWHRAYSDPHFNSRQLLSAYTVDAIRDGSIND